MLKTNSSPARSDLERRRQIILDIIKYFRTQELTGQAVALAGETGPVDQSAVSLWLKNCTIPTDRQRQLITASEIMVTRGERDIALTPDNFFYTLEEIAQRRGTTTPATTEQLVASHG